MTSTRSAIATALPSNRRGFLSQLAMLPLVGGGLNLIGSPTAVAEPVTPDVIEAYKTWLALEFRFLTWQMADDPFFIESYRNCHAADADRKTRSESISAYEWCVGDSARRHDEPYTRAALVLSAVGCDWRDHEGIFKLRRA